MSTRPSGRLPLGKRLELLVSNELDNLGVIHEHFAWNSHEDAVEKVDFRLNSNAHGRKPVDFQITLMRDDRGKVRRFVEAALRQRDRGPRVYLEIHVNKSIWRKVVDGPIKLARAVALHMKLILDQFGSFEEGKLLGAKLRINRRRIRGELNRFSLLDTVGWDWLRGLVHKIRDELSNERISARRVAQHAWHRFIKTVHEIALLDDHRKQPQQPAFARSRGHIPLRLM